MRTTQDDQDTYQRIVEELSYKYENVYSAESIAVDVEGTRADFEATATVTDYLPLLVERFCRERLIAAARVDGRISKEFPELLAAPKWPQPSPTTSPQARSTSAPPGPSPPRRSTPM